MATLIQPFQGTEEMASILVPQTEAKERGYIYIIHVYL